MQAASSRRACMNRSNVDSLAGAGALICAVSLLTPWYVLNAQSLTGIGKSGAAALGSSSLLLLGLAIAAALPVTHRIHRFLPTLAAAALALFVVVKIASPPSAAGALVDTHGGNALQATLADSFANALTKAVGLHYAPAWGIWLAAIGAGAVLAGTVAALGRDPGYGSSQPG